MLTCSDNVSSTQGQQGAETCRHSPLPESLPGTAGTAPWLPPATGATAETGDYGPSLMIRSCQARFHAGWVCAGGPVEEEEGLSQGPPNKEAAFLIPLPVLRLLYMDQKVCLTYPSSTHLFINSLKQVFRIRIVFSSQLVTFAFSLLPSSSLLLDKRSLFSASLFILIHISSSLF